MGREKLHLKLQGQEFTLDDIEFPQIQVRTGEVRDIDLTTKLTERITLRTPLISAPMDSVTGHKMAILMAVLGGIGVIHYNFLTIEDQMKEVTRVRRFEAGFVKDPLVLGQEATVGDVLRESEKNGFCSYPITEDGTLDSRMVGLIKKTDIRHREEDLEAKVTEVMTPRDQLIVADRKDTLDINDLRAANAVLRKHNLETLPIVDGDRVVALVTDRDLRTDAKYPLATKDSNKQLKVFVAVESRLEAAKERILAARAAGASGIVVDSRSVYPAHYQIAEWTKLNTPELDVIVGNIVMPEGIETAMEAAGEYIDAFRIGMGTGEVCTSTELLGLGRPMGSALYDIDQAVRRYRQKLGRHIGIIADGGIKYPVHIIGSLMLGANAVMMGSGLAGFEESPFEAVYDEESKQMVKKVRGMGSAAVIRERAGSNRYDVNGLQPDERFPEGKEKKIPYKGPGEGHIKLLFAGVRQGIQGLGHRNLAELYGDGYIIPYVRADSKGTL